MSLIPTTLAWAKRIPVVLACTIGAVLVLALAALVFVGINLGYNGSDSSVGSTSAEGAQVELDPTPSQCEFPVEEFTLVYQSHPNGVVIDGGLPDNAEGAKAKILEVAKHDPRVLRHFLDDVFAADFGTDPVSGNKDLTLTANRIEEWCRLRDFLQTVEVSVEQLSGGLVQVAAMDGEGNVSYPMVRVPAGDQVIVFTYGGKTAKFRTYCGNKVVQEPTPTPKKKVIVTPTPTPMPVFQDTPTQVPTSKPEPTKTPRPTVTPKPPVCNVCTPPLTPVATSTPPTKPTSTPVVFQTPTPPPTSTSKPPTPTPTKERPGCDICTPPKTPIATSTPPTKPTPTSVF